MRKTLQIILLSFTAGLGGAYVFDLYKTNQITSSNTTDSSQFQLVNNHGEQISNNRSALPATDSDFVLASKTSTKSVVYIKNISETAYRTSYLDWFFDRSPGKQTQISSGSGVIFSEDGYIVTNNHVVQGADRLEVVYNKKIFDAELIGTDPSTDLAVLKVDGASLPAIPLGSSKQLNVGEWVIAVGNPFNLTSTVTAGIVSAKGREINILQGKFPIESFIQTDAAINPGNSGGALVNKSGELVGINTAILSMTGSYAGYGFAVPIDIVKKIVGDLIEYGEVQKAFFGGEVSDFDAAIAKRMDINIKDNAAYEGVLLSHVQKDGAAAKAGLEENDVILSVNNISVNSRSEFEEELSYHSPGDKISITYKRDGKVKSANLSLTNREGTTSILKREIYTSESLGAQFESVPKVERDLLGIEYGVKVFNIQNGLLRRVGVSEDFVITDINRVAIDDPEKLVDILEKIRGRVIIEGVNSKGREGYYSFYLR
ncbi:S1C family serine protease [Fulvivirga sediminis]|uniref:Trypsin-like peptidase domain-containing protein n=1 Tax=Fulvivirga sediminis TaxID=2803949 RepID=A0A937F7R7_9BACT|nr:trypsin-like peptidase domain-containing protein [Fulvivirga sediminis]MBL3656587.1 trypsin-like peptidase domain-containing protein [Fulvivirga sediminis]